MVARWRDLMDGTMMGGERRSERVRERERERERKRERESRNLSIGGRQLSSKIIAVVRSTAHQ